jgi:predicted DNA-binding transcriptional regulator YafY
MRVYGLDRITHMEITEAIFDMPKDFDVDALFATSFGIYMTEGKGQTITFRTSRTEAKYFRDLPVHKSQKEESSDDESVTFSIFVCPDKNLIMEFCKYGSRVEVLSPDRIREEVAAELKAAAATYDHL